MWHISRSMTHLEFMTQFVAHGSVKSAVFALTQFSIGESNSFCIFTTLLLGRSRSGVPFQDVFSISVALSLGAVLRLSNITPEGSDARVAGRNTRWKRDNKKIFTNHIIGSIITSKDFLSVKICK